MNSSIVGNQGFGCSDFPWLGEALDRMLGVQCLERAAVANDDLVATMNAERALMRGWLTRP
jgi:hypothetical protein